jgi:hypothetical protein
VHVCGEGLGGGHEQLLLAVQEHQAVPAEERRQVGVQRFSFAFCRALPCFRGPSGVDLQEKKQGQVLWGKV